MDNKKLISQALLTIANNSTTEIIDSSDNKELIAAAEKIGLIIPSPDLSVIKTVYAEIDKVNLNGVILPRKAVEKGIKTLVGKQINWEHDGAGRICGYTIDAQINGDKIEIIGVIFKSLFPEEMETLEERFNTKKLSVSFEIWNRNMKGESVVSEDKDGNLVIDPILFHGTGLLLNSKPACPKAKVYKLLAKSDKLIIDAEKIVEKVFNENLLYAELAVEKPECKNCQTCNCGDKEENKVEEIIKEEVKLIEQTDEAKIKICPECGQPLKDEETEICAICKKKKEKSSENTETEAKADETKTEEKSEVAETKSDEAKVEVNEEVKVEEKKEEASTITTTQEKTTVDDIQPGVETITTVVNTEQVVVNDAGKEVQKVEEEIKTVITYTFEQVQEEVRVAKEEKDKEIAILKTEIETIKSELGQKNQEIETLKAKKEEITTPLDLNVGAVEIKNKDEYVEIRKNIDKRAFGEKK